MCQNIMGGLRMNMSSTTAVPGGQNRMWLSPAPWGATTTTARLNIATASGTGTLRLWTATVSAGRAAARAASSSASLATALDRSPARLANTTRSRGPAAGSAASTALRASCSASADGVMTCTGEGRSSVCAAAPASGSNVSVAWRGMPSTSSQAASQGCPQVRTRTWLAFQPRAPATAGMASRRRTSLGSVSTTQWWYIHPYVWMTVASTGTRVLPGRSGPATGPGGMPSAANMPGGAYSRLCVSYTAPAGPSTTASGTEAM